MTVHPMHDRILVRRLPEEETSKGGIIIPQMAQEKPLIAEVVEAGPGKKTEDDRIIPTTVKKGDRVLLAKYAGNEIRVNEEILLVVKEEELLAVVEG